MKAKTKTNPRSKKGDGIIKNLLYDIRYNPYLCLLALPAVIWFCVFSYAPLVYLIASFKKYSAVKGLWGSDWVGFKNFKAFFGSKNFYTVTFNTLYLNALFIISSMLVSILIAIALSEVSGKWFKKITQSVVILPHFISWTVVALLCEALLKTNNGFINNILATLGFERINFYQNADVWPALLTFLKVWQGAGYGSIVYLATITGLDQEMYEAARVDGAGRWRLMWHITLPAIKGTIIMMLILRVGGLLNTGYEQIFLMRNDLNMEYADVFDTYIYTRGIVNGQYSFSSAAGMFKSVVGMILVLGSNKISKMCGEAGIY